MLYAKTFAKVLQNIFANVLALFCKQVRKVLWTRKTPACLLILLYAYGKLLLPPVHKYSSLRHTAHRAAACRCANALRR